VLERSDVAFVDCQSGRTRLGALVIAIQFFDKKEPWKQISSVERNSER